FTNTRIMMDNLKHARVFFLLAIMITGLSACQKEDGLKVLAGDCEGACGFDSVTPSFCVRWILEKAGDIRAYDEDGYEAVSGDFSVDGNNFRAEYRPAGKNYTYTFVGLYHDVVGEITGTWGQTPSSTDGGTFDMYKN